MDSGGELYDGQLSRTVSEGSRGINETDPYLYARIHQANADTFETKDEDLATNHGQPC